MSYTFDGNFGCNEDGHRDEDGHRGYKKLSPNPRIRHFQLCASKNKMTMKKALKSKKCKSEYKPKSTYKPKSKRRSKSAGRKKLSSNPWIRHVQKCAKSHNMKFNEALKSRKCKVGYKKLH